MLGLAATAMATPSIGVFFDTAGDNANFVGEPSVIHDGYILVNNADMMVGGVAFKLESEGGFTLFNEQWLDNIHVGDLLTGIEVGFTSALPQFGDTPKSVCHFQFISMTPEIGRAHV